jgi:UDP-glucuronate decarboxylase
MTGTVLKKDDLLVYNTGNIKRKVKRVLVTGGAGFLGSHLIDRLMEMGCDVICLDNLFSGCKTNISKWIGHERFEFMRHDVTFPVWVEVDEIYHLACPASPVFYQDNPIKTIKTAFQGTLNMLGLAMRCKARILLTSTSEVYGDPLQHPQKESYWGNVNPIGIRSCYDEGKRIAETLMFEYHRQNNVDIRVARIFNTYGPRMLENDGRVVSNFICQALKGTPITVYGEGQQTRSFCYCTDQVEGLLRLMAGDHIGPINIGNPMEYTILELGTTIQKLVNPDGKIVFKPLPSDDPKKRQPDISLARKHLGWSPTVGLEQGLTETIDYFRGLINKP